MKLLVALTVIWWVGSIQIALPISLQTISNTEYGEGPTNVSPVWRALMQSFPDIVFSTDSEISSKVQSEPCHECGVRKAKVEASLSETQLTNLRVELIKQQILKKLRLRKAPQSSLLRSTLPLPLSNGTILHSVADFLSPSKDIDDFYGKTDQVILFPKGDVMPCGETGVCLTFEVPRELAEDAEVSAAQLWLHTAIPELEIIDPGLGLDTEENATAALGNCSIMLKELSTGETLAVINTSAKEGWLQIPMQLHVSRWLRTPDQSRHVLQVSCSSNNRRISLRADLKPFLTISTRAPTRPRRTKRNVNCVPGVKECCRENLHINFQDIGWGDWILHPKGYDAFFCRGSCSNAASVTQSGSFYSSILQRYLQHGNPPLERKVELAPCCTPTKLSSLQLLYVDANMVVVQKTLPNMVVDACGCM